MRIRIAIYDFWGDTAIQTTALTIASFISVDTIYLMSYLFIRNPPDSKRVIYHFDKGIMLRLICSLALEKGFGEDIERTLTL